MENTKAIILFTRQTHFSRGKPDEPFNALSWEDIDLLFSAMLNDFIGSLSNIKNVDLFLSANKMDIQEDLKSSSQEKIQIFDHTSLNLGERIRLSLNSVFENRYNKVILFFYYYPLMEKNIINKVFTQLTYEDDCIICGLNNLGTCCLVGMKTNYSNLFDKKSEDTILDFLKFFKKICVTETVLFLTSQMPTLENGYDLQRLKKEIDHCLEVETTYPKQTYEILKYIERKYSKRKTRDEAWDIRRHI